MKVISGTLLNELSAGAAASDRRRTHYNLHETLEDEFHRLCIAAEPGTYIRPHRHFDCRRWELFIVLAGRVRLVTFDDGGVVEEVHEMMPGGECVAVEFGCETWHTFVAEEPGSVVMEIKRGPYHRPPAEDMAAWAPAEKEPGMEEVERWLHTAQPGDRFRQ